LWQKYISETSRPLEVCIKEHKYKLSQGLPEKPKLAQHAYEEDNKICWKGAKVLQIETKHRLQEIQGMCPLASGRSFQTQEQSWTKR
jgi:hypothetical protein